MLSWNIQKQQCDLKTSLLTAKTLLPGNTCQCDEGFTGDDCSGNFTQYVAITYFLSGLMFVPIQMFWVRPKVNCV